MRKFLIALLILPLLVLAYYLNYCYSCQFKPKNIHGPLGLNEQNCGSIPDLKEPFTYLGEGRECYAFVSGDGRTVIKFFKSHHIKRKYWLKETKRWIQANQPEWDSELGTTARRYLMAYRLIPEESGILMLHFNQTQDLHQKIRVHKFPFSYEIDLDKVPFILQEKAEPTADRIDSLLAKGDEEEAIQHILMLRQLLIERAKKGVTDQRQCFRVNYGFGKRSALQIDVGKIEPLEGPVEDEIQRVLSNLCKWVEKNYPQLYLRARNAMQEISTSASSGSLAT